MFFRRSWHGAMTAAREGERWPLKLSDNMYGAKTEGMASPKNNIHDQHPLHDTPELRPARSTISTC